MNKFNLDLQALDSIEVWECVIKDIDGDNSLILKRELVIDGKPIIAGDQITIEMPVSESPHESNTLSFPTDSAHILATALNLMQSE